MGARAGGRMNWLEFFLRKFSSNEPCPRDCSGVVADITNVAGGKRKFTNKKDVFLKQSGGNAT
jgi:hypothetical protein